MKQWRLALGYNRIALILFTAFLLGSVLLLGRSADSAPEPLQALEWEDPERLTTDVGVYGRPVLKVAPNGKLMLAYNSKTGNNVQNPYYLTSGDGGANWTAPAPIRNSSTELRQVTLAFDNASQAHAVWRTSSSLAHAASSQWPNTSHPIYSSDGEIWDPSLAIGNDGVLHVVWAEGESEGSLYNIYYSYSINAGVSWNTPQAITSNNSQHSSVPVVAVDTSNNVHVVWEERIFDSSVVDFFRYEIQYKKGTKNGSSYNWASTTSTLSGDMIRARRPALITDGNTLHLSFARQISNDTQYPYYMNYRPGSGWSIPVDVSNNNPVAVNTNSPFYLITTLTKCSNGIYVYYHGAEVSNAKEQAFGGSTVDNFEMVDIVTTNDSRNVNPTLACVGGTLHLGLERLEAVNVNHQIYYTVSRNINKAFLPLVFRH